MLRSAARTARDRRAGPRARARAGTRCCPLRERRGSRAPFRRASSPRSPPSARRRASRPPRRRGARPSRAPRGPRAPCRRRGSGCCRARSPGWAGRRGRASRRRRRSRWPRRRGGPRTAPRRTAAGPGSGRTAVAPGSRPVGRPGFGSRARRSRRRRGVRGRSRAACRRAAARRAGVGRGSSAASRRSGTSRQPAAAPARPTGRGRARRRSSRGRRAGGRRARSPAARAGRARPRAGRRRRRSRPGRRSRPVPSPSHRSRPGRAEGASSPNSERIASRLAAGHAGRSEARPSAIAGQRGWDRIAATSGSNGAVPDARAAPRRTIGWRPPSACSTRAVFPIPASPATSTRPPRRRRADASGGAKLPDLVLAADQPDGSHQAQKVSDPAPDARSSTTWAAVTIVAPSTRSSCVMPRGFVHAPHAQIRPPAATNCDITSRRAGMPG